MHRDTVHRDILIRAGEILRKAESIVDKQRALVARMRAGQMDTQHAEAILELYLETLQAFRDTYDAIALNVQASESDLEALLRLASRFEPH
jgi:hypothetical protein